MSDEEKKIIERLAAVETRQESICEKMEDLKRKLDRIAENHLPHIRADLADLNTEVRVNSVKVAAIVGLISAIASAVLNWLL